MQHYFNQHKTEHELYLNVMQAINESNEFLKSGVVDRVRQAQLQRKLNDVVTERDRYLYETYKDECGCYEDHLCGDHQQAEIENDAADAYYAQDDYDPRDDQEKCDEDIDY